tara:strand:- start:10178 stop:10639 length:462 start_codon:yes stop_codon:yes gene_type:complete
MKLLAEEFRIENGLLADTAGGVDSARLRVVGTNKVSVIVALGTGVATTLVMKIQEHDAAAAGTTKDVVRTVPVYFKADGDVVMTKLIEDGLAPIAISALDTVKGSVVIEIHLDDLTEGFEYVSINFAAPGAARLANVDYALDTHNKAAYLHVL